jgi:hypothetical protein
MRTLPRCFVCITRVACSSQRPFPLAKAAGIWCNVKSPCFDNLGTGLGPDFLHSSDNGERKKKVTVHQLLKSIHFQKDYGSFRKKALYNILIQKGGEVFFNIREPMSFKDGIWSIVFVSSLML